MTTQTININGQSYPLRELTVGEVREYHQGIRADLLLEKVVGAPLSEDTPWGEVRRAIEKVVEITFGTESSEKN
jgi:hypothetical protein